VYLVPLFLAYYGVIFQNATVLFETYNQIKLFCSYLPSNNLWRRVLLGEGIEVQGHWPSGMLVLLLQLFSFKSRLTFFLFFLFCFSLVGIGWAAAGMLHILGTIRNFQCNTSMESE